MSKYLRIGISALLLTFLAWNTNWSDVSVKFATMRVELWLAGVALLVLAQVVSARRWQIFAKELRFEHSMMRYAAFYFIGTYFNLLLPTSVGGDVTRVWYLNGNSGRKLAALASVFLERLNGLAVLIALACVGVLVSPIALPNWVAYSVWSIAGGAALAVAALPLLNRWHRLPLQRREQLRTALQLVHVPRVLASATVMSIIVQVLGVLCVWCVAISLGLDISFAYCCILVPMVSLLTLLPLSVNGMGVREYGTVLFLTPLSIDDGSAKTLAFLWFAATVTVSLFGGLVYLFGAFPKAETAPLANEGTNDNGSVDRDSDQGRKGQYPQAA